MPATIPTLQEGRYSIEQEFSSAENCSVYLAYDTEAESPVTIVEVPVSLPKVATAAQREALGVAFNEKASTLSALKHPSVVAVRHHFSDGGRNYLVTDPVDGADLASVLKDQPQPFSVSEVCRWADTLLDALNVMHGKRPTLVYKNLSPANIVLRADGDVALTAAGSMFPDQRSATLIASDSPIVYSPLEQIWGGLDAASQKVIINKYDESSEKILKQDLDEKSDLYSLGATLYHLVTGEFPTDALERSIEMIDGNEDPLLPPSKVNADVPTEVSDVIMKAMEIKREYRFDSAAIMRQVLKTALVRVQERQGDAPNLADQKADEPKAIRTEKPAASENPVPEDFKDSSSQGKTALPRDARPTETFNLSDIDDDLLGLMSPSAHTSEPPQPKAAIPVRQADSEISKVEPSPGPKETKTKVIETKLAADEPKAIEETVEVESPVEDVETAAPPAATPAEGPEHEPGEPALTNAEKSASYDSRAAAASAVQSSILKESDFLSSETSKKPLPIAAMAAAAVVLCIVAVGGWFLLGSKAAPPPATLSDAPASSQPVQANEPPSAAFPEPAQVNPPVQTSSVETQSAPADQIVTDQPVSGQSQKTASSVTPSRQKKPAEAPARTPAPKKAVTVDDLINDN